MRFPMNKSELWGVRILLTVILGDVLVMLIAWDFLVFIAGGIISCMFGMLIFFILDLKWGHLQDDKGLERYGFWKQVFGK